MDQTLHPDRYPVWLYSPQFHNLPAFIADCHCLYRCDRDHQEHFLQKGEILEKQE